MSENRIITPIAKFFINGQGFDVRQDSEAEQYGSVDGLSYETVFMGNGKHMQKGSYVDSGMEISLSCNDASEFETLRQLLRLPEAVQLRLEFVDGKQVSFSGRRSGELNAEENFAMLRCKFCYETAPEIIDR